uniref:Lipoamide acyltransferase component of branched-chain alpha-keto acid dehydrogenase complex, mitochondrial n=1 Tax=Albugo laibachii Nc14 TaxID=890382 RepID=F0WGD4_9STRA|nr:conserved hypothetical protein [Albugo laibachii Nc14]|eukprot:CCA20295.1 conserved hypothetical protein [Albugo laibachii Nc14]
MGDSISEGTLVETLKEKGESVQEDQVVAVLETDKLSVDVRSPVAGTIVAYHANLDDSVKVGKPLFSVDGSQTSKESQDTSMEKSTASTSTPSTPSPDEDTTQATSPASRRTPLIQFLGKRTTERNVPVEKKESNAAASSTLSSENVRRVPLSDSEIQAINTGIAFL